MNNIMKGFVFLAIFPGQKVLAEVIVDGSLGGTIQEVSGPIYKIQEALGQRHGMNLFHSFSQFNINAGEQAHFTTLSTTQNILTRVTGGKSSLIDGIISTDSPANIWLMNPAGWVVGQNAQLNVQGAFHLSTADSIGFGNGNMFFADPQSNSVLTAAAPIDYQFNQGSQALITLDQADLILPGSQDISLVGGNVTIKNSSISTSGGRLLLASNLGQGQLRLDDAGLTLLSGAGGTITIEHDRQAGLLKPSLTSSDFNAEISAGTVQLTAKQINLKNAFIATQAWDNKDAGNTILNAKVIQLDSSFINNEVLGAKNAGNVIIIADELSMENGSRINSNTAILTMGNGGDIRLELSGQLVLSDQSSISSTALAGQGGDIQLQAKSIILNNNSSIRVASQADNNAGNLNIASNQLTINDRSILDTSTLFGAGRGGDITLTVDTIALTQDSLITSASFAEGDAGIIKIQSNSLFLANGSEIRAASLGTGATGSIKLNIDDINLQDSSINTLAFETDGGVIEVDSQVLVLNHSEIVTSVEGGQGNGGNIGVNTGTLIMNGGFIQANTVAVGASGGDILVNSDNTLASHENIIVGGDQRQLFSLDSMENVIQAAAPDGVNGQVNLNTVELNIAGQMTKLDSSFAVRKNIAEDPCNIPRNEEISSLIQMGQGGFPVKASDSINLPLHRHLPRKNQPSQSQLKPQLENFTLFTANLHCKKDQ